MEVFACGLDDRIAVLMAQMTARRIRHLPVMNDDGLCGIASIGDVVKNRLEEIENESEVLREYVTTASAHPTCRSRIADE